MKLHDVYKVYDEETKRIVTGYVTRLSVQSGGDYVTLSVSENYEMVDIWCGLCEECEPVTEAE